MAKRDPTALARKRRRAAQMERRGMTARQIADVMGVKKVATVQKWLRIVRGPKKSAKPKVIKLLDQGLAFADIAKIAGCSVENVVKIEREKRGYLKRGHRHVDEMLQDYLEDPIAKRNERYTQYESFGKKLVVHCHHVTNTNPVDGKGIIDAAIEQFSLLRKVLRSPAKIKAATCNLVQVTAADAARERALDRPEVGLRVLRGLASDFPGCSACAADLARRESMILRDLGRSKQALRKLRASQALYTSMDHSGHDGLSNGPGHCAVLESSLHYFMKNPEIAFSVADHALEKLVDESETFLFVSLRFNKALALLEFDSPDRLQMARQISEDLYVTCGSEASIPRLRIAWLSGRAAERLGDLDTSLLRYEDAYEDAQELKIPSGLGALLADMERLKPNPTSLQSRIRRLRIWRDGKPLNSFPSWLQPIAPVMIGSFHQSKSSIEEALSLLRRESGGDKFLPLDAAMSSLLSQGHP